MFIEEQVLPVMFGFTSKERDQSEQPKQSTQILRTAGFLSCPSAKKYSGDLENPVYYY